MVADILKKVEATYQQTQAFTASFHQSVTSAAVSTMSTEASGRLYYEKPRQMRWEYDKPEPQVFVANRQLAWLYVPCRKTDLAFRFPKRSFLTRWRRLFSRASARSKSTTKSPWITSNRAKKRPCSSSFRGRKTPKSRLFSCLLNCRPTAFRRSRFYNALGNANRISLDSLKAVASLDPKLFQMDIPPSVDVVDAEGRPLTPAEIERLKLLLKSDK